MGVGALSSAARANARASALVLDQTPPRAAQSVAEVRQQPCHRRHLAEDAGPRPRAGRAARSSRRELARTPEAGGASPIAWSADGTSVFVLEPDGTGSALWSVPVDGSRPLRVALDSGFVSALSVASGVDAFAFALERPDRPPEVYVRYPGSVSASRVSDLNGDFDRTTIAETELVSWPTADGTSSGPAGGRPKSAPCGRGPASVLDARLAIQVRCRGSPGRVGFRWSCRAGSGRIRRRADRGTWRTRPVPGSRR